MNDLDDFMGGGGSSVPAFKFDHIGATVSGSNLTAPSWRIGVPTALLSRGTTAHRNMCGFSSSTRPATGSRTLLFGFAGTW